MRIAVNGRVCEDKEAVVSVYDHGFLYGIGLFETFRTYGGRPFLLEPHLERLSRSCTELGIRYVSDRGETEGLIAALLSANGLPDAYVRFSVSAGVELLGLPSTDYAEPNVIVYVKPLPPRDEIAYAEGKPIQLLELRRNSPEGNVRLKSFQYMNNMLAKREMRRYEWAAGAEGVFLDACGHVAEGIVSNLFWVKGGVLYTPALATGILPGITREYVIGLARRLGYEVREGLYGWPEIIGADEAFLTNSVQEIVPVNRGYELSGKERRIGSGTVGTITTILMKAYGEATRL
ncbi:aminodeoxychorismate lyase [Paenibacillus hemerocallicola]|uniref:Aminodeoxychorismate lyase n=1 Tax=Paenibacillus hemerocallicola TaxID=1172614 RepID=A0A5C4T195_9BACL|nr:aminodeoxychorismate lyase [Paenibacillus hemerocallicola]TNJ62520.1 aminodeoxychorismate lyase [Paenibacillus hemerocallicola]